MTQAHGEVPAHDPTIREEPKRTLQALDVHREWAANYRTPENERFYAASFDVIAQIFGPPGDDPVLDAGCGSGTKSLLLARRGFRVLGIDFSEAILADARAAARDAGVADRVEFAPGDLTDLRFETGSIRRILCWGVLMHIPAVDRAVAELSRVLAPGGLLVVSEGNMNSAQARALRALKAVLRRGGTGAVRTPAGIEVWEKSSAGMLLTRQANIKWLIGEFGRHGLKLVTRRAGQATEIYTMMPWRPARRAVHAFNQIWFEHVRWGGPAFGNLLVFRKASAVSG